MVLVLKNSTFYARKITTRKPAILFVFVGPIPMGFFGTGRMGPDRSPLEATSSPPGTPCRLFGRTGFAVSRGPPDVCYWGQNVSLARTGNGAHDPNVWSGRA
jgi:hypothetical protein